MKGKIIENSANLYKVVDLEENIIYSCNARGILKNLKITPVVGDMVEFSKDEKVIEKIYDRNNYIKRPKIANITKIIYVVSVKNPKPDLLLLDKQLAFAESIGVKSLIIINKCDLGKKEEIDELVNTYKKVGYDIIEISAINNLKLEELRSKLKGETSVLAGNSGVGKSTIINSLFKNKVTQEGKISEKNKKGKNTTTLVKLYELEEKTFIADAPGFSTFEINEIEKSDLSHYFIEFLPFIEKCSYVGCSHINEKIDECEIKRQVEDGNISKSRYNNYCKIYEELKNYKKW